MESPRNAATNGEWRRVCRIDLSLSFYEVGGVTSNFRGGKKKKGRRGTLSLFYNDELKSITINHFTVQKNRPKFIKSTQWLWHDFKLA